MGLIYVNTWCRSCKSDNVICSYNEELNEIVCYCLECYERGSLKDFDYEMDGNVDFLNVKNLFSNDIKRRWE